MGRKNGLFAEQCFLQIHPETIQIIENLLVDKINYSKNNYQFNV